MIHLTTNNNEQQILVGVRDTDYNFSLEQNNYHVWFLKKKQEGNRVMFVPLNYVKNPAILGTFDKEKNEIDFDVNSNWLQPFTETGVIGETYVLGYKNYDKEFENFRSFKESYLSLLQSVTKESEYNKFVVLKTSI